MQMNRYEKENSIEKIQGYYLKTPQQSDEETFTKAKNEAIKAYTRTLECIQQIDFKTFMDNKQ